jgi:hypothetical protein
MRALPLHYARPLAVQVLFAHLLPLGFGAVCGIALGASKPAYVALSVLAAIGGFAAGLEHDGALDGASRGVAGGLLFGAGLLIAHDLAGTTPTVELPDPEVLLIVVTTVAGTVLGAAGGALRGRAERRAAQPEAPGAAEATRPTAEVESAAAEAAEQHTALVARAERAEQAAAEAQAESRRAAELVQEHDARALSAERRVQESEQQLTRLQEELQQARAEAAGTEELQSKTETIAAVAAQLESRAAAFERRAGEVEAAATGAVEEHAALAARAERAAQAAEEHVARAERTEWAEQVAKKHAALAARAERAERAAAQAQAQSHRLAEELGSKTEAIAAVAAQLESRAASLERRADEVVAAAQPAAWWPRVEQAEVASPPVGEPRVRWEQDAPEAAPSGLKWSDPVRDELKRREREFSAKVERLATELSWGGAGVDLSELRRQLADAEERRDRLRARIEERETLLFERYRTGGGSAPSGGPGR